MKRYLGVVVLVFVGTAGWRIGDSLSPDALSMAVGVLFGVMAGMPAALLVLASGRRREPAEEPRRARPEAYALAQGQGMMGGYIPQPPPVIVVAGPPALQNGMGGQTPAYAGPNWDARPQRSFKVVGEREEWLEDW